ncbi:MAG: hypothetical protein ACYDCC_09510 [Actinomycetota bacterium]
MTRKLFFGVMFAAGSSVMLGSLANASTPKPPVLMQFDARFDQSQTTTFYIVNAYDPGGSKLDYHWSLTAQCGFLTDPNGTGPSNGFQFGPPASRPSGCTRDQQESAVVAVRIANHAGCAIVYSQNARDETQHVRPAVQTGPCPPTKTSATTPVGNASSFPISLLVGVLLALGGGYALIRMRAHSRSRRGSRAVRSKADDDWNWSEEQPASEPAVQKSWLDPRPPGLEPELEDDATSMLTYPDLDEEDSQDHDDETLQEPALEFLGSSPCEDGAVRGAGNDFVAHETVLSGTIRALAPQDRLIEVDPMQPQDITALASLLEERTPLEVEVEIPLRLVTVVCTRREICRDGHWRLDIQSQTHDGPERIERLRAIVGSSEELERFADQILAKRLRSLLEARRRLEETLANLVPDPTSRT